MGDSKLKSSEVKMENIPIRRINTSEAFSDSFVIRDVDEMLNGEDMFQELHRHDFFYILVLEKGTGAHEIDFVSYPIDDNCIFFMRPGQIHRLRLEAGSSGYLVQFNTDFYYRHESSPNRLLRRASSTNLYKIEVSRFKKVLYRLANIFEEYFAKEEDYQEVIQRDLDVFFIELIRETGKTESTGINPYFQERLEQFSELLELHLSSHKKPSQYADMLNLSLYQLSAITKSLLGKTPSELINESIILESKRQLLATSNQINQIAFQLGYEDVSYFIRFFKKHTGYSPEAFRNNYK